MLDSLRQGTQNKFAKIILAGIFGVIILSFAMWGEMGTSLRSAGSEDSMATVNGQKITVREFNQALKEKLDQYRAARGGDIDPNLGDNPEFRRFVLDDLVKQHVLLADATRS